MGKESLFHSTEAAYKCEVEISTFIWDKIVEDIIATVSNQYK